MPVAGAESEIVRGCVQGFDGPAIYQQDHIGHDVLFVLVGCGNRQFVSDPAVNVILSANCGIFTVGG